MNLLYIVGKRSGWDHNELRYSIRSACKWADVDSVTIAGYCPPWLRPTLHVECEDTMGTHQLNIAAKMLTACMDERTPETFLLMWDDFYIVDVPDMRWRHSGLLSEHVQRLNLSRGQSDWFRKSQEDVLQFLRTAGVPEPLNFSTHTPFAMCKAEALVTAEAALSLPIGGDLMTIHAALHEGDIVQGHDAKSLWPRIVGPYVSSGEHHESDHNFRRWLHEQFHTPSPFEL